MQVGGAQLTVTFQGHTSEPYPLAIVDASPGFFSSETAPEAPISAGRPLSAAPGETVTLWATGTGGAAPEIFVGSQPAGAATVAEAECCRGVQRVEFRVPAAPPQGCFVPVLARTPDARVSNAVHIAVHAPGEACRDQVDWFRESVEHAERAGFVVLARVALDIHIVPRSGMLVEFDYGVGSFGRQEAGQRVFPPLPPLRTCTVLTAHVNIRQILGDVRSPAGWTSIPQKTPGNRRLDVGSAIAITGPGGSRQLARNRRQQEYYDALLGGTQPFSREPPSPLFLRAGTYTVSAPGGRDAGPFFGETGRRTAHSVDEPCTPERCGPRRGLFGGVVKAANPGHAVLIAAG